MLLGGMAGRVQRVSPVWTEHHCFTGGRTPIRFSGRFDMIAAISLRHPLFSACHRDLVVYLRRN